MDFQGRRQEGARHSFPRRKHGLSLDISLPALFLLGSGCGQTRGIVVWHGSWKGKVPEMETSGHGRERRENLMMSC